MVFRKKKKEEVVKTYVEGELAEGLGVPPQPTDLDVPP